LQGDTGPKGDTGPRGRTGAKGTPGPSGAGSIIAYASGSPIYLSTTSDGLADAVAHLGFGNSGSSFLLPNRTIDLSFTSLGNSYFVYTMPREGILDHFCASFSTTATLNLVDSSATVFVDIFATPSGSNSFTSLISLALAPTITGIVNIGTVLSGNTTGLSTVLAPNTNFIVVVSATSTGEPLAGPIVGYASSGLNII
jgi:BclB C-terminal domain-containing protein